MANYKNIGFARLIVSLGMCVLLTGYSDCRPASVPGTVTTTRATSFRWFFEKIANPCEVRTLPGTVLQSSPTSSATTATSIAQHVPVIDFYHSMESALKETMMKLQMLESADPSLPECNGISLDSLPVTPLMDNMNAGETIKQAYKTVIYLTTHFHLISSDRQISVTVENGSTDNQQLQPESSLPYWRFQRCGNETESFPSILVDVTTALENVLCTILSSATAEQTQSFREPLSSLQETVLYRYHTSCSTLQTRDCLVVREAKEALTLISRKYGQLIQQRSHSNGSNLDLIEDDMDNNI